MLLHLPPFVSNLKEEFLDPQFWAFGEYYEGRELRQFKAHPRFPTPVSLANLRLIMLSYFGAVVIISPYMAYCDFHARH